MEAFVLIVATRQGVGEPSVRVLPVDLGKSRVGEGHLVREPDRLIELAGDRAPPDHVREPPVGDLKNEALGQATE